MKCCRTSNAVDSAAIHEHAVMKCSVRQSESAYNPYGPEQLCDGILHEPQ